MSPSLIAHVIKLALVGLAPILPHVHHHHHHVVCRYQRPTVPAGYKQPGIVLLKCVRVPAGLS